MKFFKGRRVVAALLMCLLVLLLIILPLTEVLVLAARNSVTVYGNTVNFLQTHNDILQNTFLAKASLWGLDTSSLKNFILDIVSRSSNFMMNSATMVVEGMTSFILSLLLIILTMFFFFVDGEQMMKKLMLWSPLPNKYDKRLFNKFRDVSYTTIVSTFVVMVVQGVIGGLGYFIIGLPAFLAGVIIAFCSLIPVFGPAIIYAPTGIYLILVGQVWQGVFILLWGFGVVSTVDNIIRSAMIKGKANVNPIFVFLSIIGGVALFGFWGIVLGPLVVSLAITIFHIYELEFKHELEEAE